METKRTATALVLFLCTAFLLWWGATSYDVGSSASANSHITSASASSYTMVVHHSRQDASNIYKGSVASTACQGLATGVQTQGEDPVHLTVHLTRINAPDCISDDMSAVAAEEPFFISIDAGSNNPRLEHLMLDGEEVAFTVIED